MRTLQADYQGKTYDIPEIWIAGFCRAKHEYEGGPRLAGATILEAVACWAYQQELADLDTR